MRAWVEIQASVKDGFRTVLLGTDDYLRYRRSGRWRAKVKFRGEVLNLGTYSSEEEAAKAADAKRRELMPFYVPAAERVS